MPRITQTITTGLSAKMEFLTLQNKTKQNKKSKPVILPPLRSAWLQQSQRAPEPPSAFSGAAGSVESVARKRRKRQKKSSKPGTQVGDCCFFPLMQIFIRLLHCFVSFSSKAPQSRGGTRSQHLACEYFSQVFGSSISDHHELSWL